MQNEEINYSQNGEQKVITDYFKDSKGTLLDIGANDGITFSNSKRLIELGWGGILVEPSPQAFRKLVDLHIENENILLMECAIAEEDGTMVLHESSHHLPDKSDYALLSTLKPEEIERWKGTVDFKPVEVKVCTWETLCRSIGMDKDQYFDFISIDAEGLDVQIMKQIDLSKTKMICVEHNGNEEAKQQILLYANRFGLAKTLYYSGENIIIAR